MSRNEDRVEDEMDDAELDEFAVDMGLVDAREEDEDDSPTGAGDYDKDAEKDEKDEAEFAAARTAGAYLPHAAYYGAIDVEGVREAAAILDASIYTIESTARENSLDRKSAFETIVSELRNLVSAFGLEFTEPVLGDAWKFDGTGALIIGHFMSDVPAHDSKNLKKRETINTKEHGRISVVVARVWNEWCRALGEAAWTRVAVWNVVPYKAHASADSSTRHKGKPLVSNEMLAMWEEWQLIERGVRCAVSLLSSHTIVTFGERAADFFERSPIVKATKMNTATAHICYLRAHGVARERAHATRVNIRQEHYAAFGKAVDDILDAPAVAAVYTRDDNMDGADTPGTIAAKAFMKRTMAKMSVKEMDGEFHAYTREEARERQRQRARECAREYRKRIYTDSVFGGPDSKFTIGKFWSRQRALQSRVPQLRHTAKNVFAWDMRKFWSRRRALQSRVPQLRHTAKNVFAWDQSKFASRRRALQSRVPQLRHTAKNVFAWDQSKFASRRRTLQSRVPQLRHTAKNVFAWDQSKFGKRRRALQSRVPQLRHTAKNVFAWDTRKFESRRRTLQSRVPQLRHMAKNVFAWNTRKFESRQRALKSRVPQLRHMAKNVFAWDTMKFWSRQRALKSRVPQLRHMAKNVFAWDTRKFGNRRRALQSRVPQL